MCDCKEKCKVRFSALATDVRASGNIEVDRLSAGFLAINKGDVLAYVNQVPLLPAPAAGVSGEGMAIDANENEIYTGQISVSFATSTGNPYVVIVQKFYLP